MADDTATIIAALIGAAFGSVGATLISDWLKRRGEKIVLHENLINRYLLQAMLSLSLSITSLAYMSES
jgi:hypothetical protein